MAEPGRDPLLDKARSALYWRLFASVFDQGEAAPGFDAMA